MEFVKLSQGQEKMEFMEKEGKNIWNLGSKLRKREKLKKLAKCQKYGYVGCKKRLENLQA